jgi:hypothetical protein
MGQYRLSIHFQYQLGLMLKYNNQSNFIEIHFPFIQILIGLDSDAHGFSIFD